MGPPSFVVQGELAAESARGTATQPNEGCMEDLTKLSKTKLVELVTQLLEDRGEQPTNQENNARVRELESALIATNRKAQAARLLAEQAADERVYEVKSIVDLALSVSVRDRRGELVLLQFPQRGTSHFLTASQVLQVRNEVGWMFDNGYLMAPEIVEPSANAIPDLDEYLQALPYDQVPEEIAKLTSIDVLQGLFNHIDGLRFQFVEEGGQTEVKRVEIDPKYQVVQHAISDRVRALTGLRLTEDPSR